MKETELRKTMKSMRGPLFIALLAASLFSVQIKAQTTDETVITTDPNPAAWTTGQIQRPAIDQMVDGNVAQVYFNDNNNSQDGYWHAIDYSDDIAVLDPGVWGNGFGTLQVVPDSAGGTNTDLTYMLSDVQNGHHGVMSTMDREMDWYGATVKINYTDTATNQPAEITVNLPNEVAQLLMNWDTTATIPFQPSWTYNKYDNTAKFDSIMDNIYDIQVNAGLANFKEDWAETNETSPFSGAGDDANSTLEELSNDALNNVHNPEIFSLMLEQYKKSATVTPPSTFEGPNPSDDSDIGEVVYKAADGSFTVTQLAPDAVTTYPGATWGNAYKYSFSDNTQIPNVTADAGSLPTDIIVTQVDDSTYKVTVSAKTPEGQATTNTLEVVLDATTVGIPNIPKPEDYDATNFPNPFTDNTTLQYSLKNDDFVKIEVYDMQGRVVREVFEGNQKAGTHSVSIDGSNLSSGMYFGNITSTAGGSYSVKFVKQ